MLDSLNKAEAQSKAAAAEAAGRNSNKVGIVSSDPKTGITVYRDSGGGTVLSGLPVPYTASPEEQARQQKMLDSLNQSEAASNRMASSGNYVDYESNPIYIGTWHDTACYARHTLGAYNSSLGYLTSYGYATHYNPNGDNALPYRNGAANGNSGQGVVDVAKFDYFSIRDLGTDQGLTLQITDWGPNQIDAPDRIADLDNTAFKNMHGNLTDGVFYCRTWVPITNYNPGS